MTVEQPRLDANHRMTSVAVPDTNPHSDTARPDPSSAPLQNTSTQQVHLSSEYISTHADQSHSLADAPSGSPNQFSRSKQHQRHSLSLEQRRALRRWANEQPTRPSHKQCIEWFRQHFKQTISQSTVSHSLSPKYARLDGDPQLSGSRLRFGNWPDVEKIVLVWYRSMLHVGKQPNNEELQVKAREIFTALPRYKETEPPGFSPGWIHRFKKRYGLLRPKTRDTGSPQLPSPSDDLNYLVDAVPRFMEVRADTPPDVIREKIHHLIGIPTSLDTCVQLVNHLVHHHNVLDTEEVDCSHMLEQDCHEHHVSGDGNDSVYAPPPGTEDTEMVLHHALRAMQHENEVEARQRIPHSAVSGQSPAPAYAKSAAAAASTAAATLATSVNGARIAAKSESLHISGSAVSVPRYSTGAPGLNLTPIPSDGPTPMDEPPVRCPFCLNHRMLRSIQEAVEHLSTHVVL